MNAIMLLIAVVLLPNVKIGFLRKVVRVSVAPSCTKPKPLRVVEGTATLGSGLSERPVFSYMFRSCGVFSACWTWSAAALMNRPFVPVGRAWHWAHVKALLSRLTFMYSLKPDWAL